MLEQIQGNYTQRLTLGTLARDLGRQPAYLGRLFREEVGFTVHEYITRARMENGAAQVRSGVKIEAVALTVGYQSKKNFYLQFKRRFGCTPDTYRSSAAGVGEPVAVQSSGHDLEDATFNELLVERAETLKTAVERLAIFVQRTTVRTFVGSRVAMLITDQAGRCISANGAAAFMTGYSVAELRGMPVEALFLTELASNGNCFLQVLPSGSTLPTNAVLRTKSNDAVDVHQTNAENLLWACREMTSVLVETHSETFCSTTSPKEMKSCRTR
jgi:AraC-like DNA-binding protein